jgi:hypothetical protein
MKIPLLNIYIMTEATFERLIKKAVMKTRAFQPKQMGLLLHDNALLSKGIKKKRSLRFLRKKK